MKVEVKENKTEGKSGYPRLVTSGKQIILMTRAGCGFVIDSSINNVGYYSVDWDMDLFKPFNGSITLSND